MLFREPGATDISLAVFSASSIETFLEPSRLNGKTGYVFAPFEPTATHPIVLLNQPTVYVGEEFIRPYLESILTHGIEESVHADSLLSFDEGSEEKKQYEVAFSACHSAINQGKCQKLVLSRKHTIRRPDSFSAGNLFEKACGAYPEAYVYLFHTPITGTWLGSTPEALLLGKGESWQTVALAGTQQSIDKTCVSWDVKNREEQQIVTDYVEQALDGLGLRTEKYGPVSINAGQLVHLKTTFQFSIPCKKELSLGTLIDILHPTPATCGYPKDMAMRLIKDFERHDRSYYCGFVGAIRNDDETQLYVNLRCMSITPNTLILYAGGGILAESSCESEWEETESKLQTLLSLLT